MDVRVRPWTEVDIPRIVRYWKSLRPEEANRMGCDIARIPPAEEYTRILTEQFHAPADHTAAFYSIWTIDGHAIGFASLKNIQQGVRGEMHLHIWDESQRGRGLGGQLFCLSAVDFYDRFKVKEIVCEPGASNPLPNRMLQKAGFPLIGSRVGKSSDISLEVQLNTYVITREAALRYLSRSILWDASDYAKNSQGQFGWAMGNIDKLRLQPGERVLDVGCGDGKITAELARRVPGGNVVGIDRSEAMIGLAERAVNLPNVAFRVLDGQALDYSEAFDAVFSNSAIHWMPDQRLVVEGIARALKPRGRIFLSMGGKGTAAIPRRVLDELTQNSPWGSFLAGAIAPHHFRGPEEYGPWLSEAGLVVDRVELVKKPMKLASLEALEGWLRTTWMSYTERIPENPRAAFIHEWAARVAVDCEAAEGGTLMMPMVNLEVEARKA